MMLALLLKSCHRMLLLASFHLQRFNMTGPISQDNDLTSSSVTKDDYQRYSSYDPRFHSPGYPSELNSLMHINMALSLDDLLLCDSFEGCFIAVLLKSCILLVLSFVLLDMFGTGASPGLSAYPTDS